MGANRVVEASCEGLTSDNNSSRWLVDFRFVNASPSESKEFNEGKKSHFLYDGGKKNSGQKKAKQGNLQGKKSSRCFIYNESHGLRSVRSARN